MRNSFQSYILVYVLLFVLFPEPDAGGFGYWTNLNNSSNYYIADAAKALVDYEDDAETIARKAMAVAADVCVFTNGNVTVETV